MRVAAICGAVGICATLTACAVGPGDAVTARQDFATHCSGCHGSNAQGGEVLIGGATVQAPDLTLLASKNGGVFPRQQVMAQIDGYARGDRNMPEFGEIMLEGDTVLVDFGDGVATPTPVRLVALADYLQSLQQ